MQYFKLTVLQRLAARVRIVRVIEAQTTVLHLNHTNDHVERHTKKNGNPVLG